MARNLSLNDQHIETIEATPDSVITLTNEKKYIVTESVRGDNQQDRGISENDAEKIEG